MAGLDGDGDGDGAEIEPAGEAGGGEVVGEGVASRTPLLEGAFSAEAELCVFERELDGGALVGGVPGALPGIWSTVVVDGVPVRSMVRVVVETVETAWATGFSVLVAVWSTVLVVVGTARATVCVVVVTNLTAVREAGAARSPTGLVAAPAAFLATGPIVLATTRVGFSSEPAADVVTFPILGGITRDAAVTGDAAFTVPATSAVGVCAGCKEGRGADELDGAWPPEGEGTEGVTAGVARFSKAVEGATLPAVCAVAATAWSAAWPTPEATLTMGFAAAGPTQSSVPSSASTTKPAAKRTIILQE
jgi:hypothetical protein